MTSQPGGSSGSSNFYSLPNRSESSTSLSFSHSSNGGYKSTQQPSFTASTSSLPGALGIGISSSSSSTSILQGSATFTSPTLPPLDRTKMSGMNSSTSHPNLGVNGAGETRPVAMYQMRSNSSASLLGEGVGPRIARDGLQSTETNQRPATIDSNLGGNNNTRNFLVPIGATGARQKLSILSASQRPMTGTKAPPTATQPQRSRTSSDLDYEQNNGIFRRRPQTGEDGRPTLSSSRKENSYRNIKRPATGTGGNSNRSFSNDSLNYSRSSESQWSADWSSSGGIFGQTESSATPTQERPNPILYRQTSHDEKGRLYSTRSSPSQAIDSPPTQRNPKMHRRLVSTEQASPQKEGTMWDGQTDSHSNSRPSDYGRSKQTNRPSSSSGKDRAAKLGAGFKQIFSSKSAREQSPKVSTTNIPDTSPPSTLSPSMQGSHPSPSSPYQTSTSRYPRQTSYTTHSSSRSASASTSASSDQSSHQHSSSLGYVDMNTAQSAGWTTSHEKNTSTSISSAAATRPSTSSLLFSNSNNERGLYQHNNGLDQSRTAKSPPSLDLNIPISRGLLDGLSSDQFFSYNEESSNGSRSTPTTRMSKGAPTTGLNLEVAGQAMPGHRLIIDQGLEEDEDEKSLPPTPLYDTQLTDGIEGRHGQQRNYSEASGESENTIQGPSASTSQSPSSASQLWSTRVASISSFSDASRRGSTATTLSDAHGSHGSASDTQHTPDRRTSSARSASGESTYSAPNSSRAWSPAAFDKPNVPLSSPLLASVLSQQQQSSPNESTMVQQKRVISPLGGSTIFGPSESSMTETSSTAPSTPSSIRSRSSTIPKPEIPTRSKERPPALQADPATLAKLEMGSLQTPLSAQSGQTFSSDGSSTDTAKTPTRETPEKASRSMYVPPGALTYTRKGTAVRPMANKSSDPARVESFDAGDTPRASMDRKLNGGSDGVFSSQYSMVIGKTLSKFQARNGESTGVDGQIISFNSNDFDSYEDETSLDAVNLLPSSAWVEVEAALSRFKSMSMMQNVPSDKGSLLRSVLLPFLALEAETPNVEVSGIGPFQSGKTRRALFFEWIQHLLLELQTVQTSADRGAILESIACIIESRNFSAPIFQADVDDGKKFYSVFGHILNYAIGELNKKGVYQNTLIFSGRLLAVAFFRVEGVASKLLRALPVNRFALERVASEAKWDVNSPMDWESYKRRFPPSLTDFCFQDARSYLKMLDSHTNISSTNRTSGNEDDDDDDDRYLVRQPEVEVEMSGNWLRRWQSDDSELFFSFCRSYHRQLAGLLNTGRTWESMRGLFFGGPGYAHLATCIHQKCLSLVHRDILSVTTLSSQKNFNPGETANVLSGSTAGKPRHLEAANRRCTAIVVDVIRAPSSNTQIFGPMLGIHIKSLIKRTSLYDVQGVFCLLDWLDGVLSHMETAELPIERLVDIEFVIQTVWLLLKDADHALALMRTIAFCYSNFAVLTSTSKNRIRFCEEILLHPKIFQKLFLSWSFTIRAYFLHLLVFRLARINDFAQPEDDVKGKTAISVARLFNRRLDEIRRRHDELSPSPSSADSGSEEDSEMGRFKNRPQSFVSTIKRTPSASKVVSPGAMTKAERVLGIGLPDPALSSKGDNKAQSRAAKWLRALGSKGSSKNVKRSEGARIGSPSFLADSPTMETKTFQSPRLHNDSQKRMAKVDELDLFSDEDGNGDDDDHDSYPGDDGGDSTPRAEGTFEFSFDAQPGQQDQQSSLFGASLADLSPRSKGTTLPNEDHDKSINDHISPKLSFDLQNPASSLPPHSSTDADGKLPIPSSHGSGRVSRAFSKRESILPGPAFNLVNHESESEEEDGLKSGAASADMDPASFFAYQRNLKKKQQIEKADPYSQNLHIYAVQSLREYEQTVLEHDEFFSKQTDTNNPQVPRLPIQWPAMWSE